MQVLGGPSCVCAKSAAMFPVMLFAKGCSLTTTLNWVLRRLSVLQILTSADLENTCGLFTGSILRFVY
jgi:hypothetical protein